MNNKKGRSRKKGEYASIASRHGTQTQKKIRRGDIQSCGTYLDRLGAGPPTELASLACLEGGLRCVPLPIPWGGGSMSRNFEPSFNDKLQG